MHKYIKCNTLHFDTGAIQAREIVRDAIQDTQVEPPSGRRRSSQGQKRRSGAIEHQLEKQGDLSPLVSQSEPQTDVKKRGSAPPGNETPPKISCNNYIKEVIRQGYRVNKGGQEVRCMKQNIDMNDGRSALSPGNLSSFRTSHCDLLLP